MLTYQDLMAAPDEAKFVGEAVAAHRQSRSYKIAVDADLYDRRQNVTVENDIAYDVVYAANMIKADRWGSSVRNDEQLAAAIKDELDDPDGYEGQLFSRFLSDCNGKGIPIIWEDVI